MVTRLTQFKPSKIVSFILLLFASTGIAKPSASDRFGVVGVIAQKSSPMSKQSLAVIRDTQTNKNLVVRVGDKLPGGFAVKSIQQKEVRIIADGREFIVSPKSFDGVGSVASAQEAANTPPELDDEDIRGEFIEPPPPGSPPGTEGESYTMSPGEIRDTPTSRTEDYPSTRRPIVPPPPPRTPDGFGRSGRDVPTAPPAVPVREAEFDDSFSGFDDLFEEP